MSDKAPPPIRVPIEVELTDSKGKVDKAEGADDSEDTPKAEETPVFSVVDLMNAVRYGTRTHIAYILDSNKTLIDQYDDQGSTCFHWAAKRGEYDILDLLKQYYGSILDVAANCENQMRPQHWAASDGKVTSLKFFLDNRADLNCADGNGCTPLAVAVQYMHTDAALYLIKHGADLALKDTNGDSPLHWAAYKGSEELVGLLLHFMPRELDSEDHFGQAPLHLAALAGHERVVEYLIRENGADCSKKDKNGLTPLDLAIKKKQTRVEWVLRKFKATNKLDLFQSIGFKRLREIKNFMPFFICGFGDRETGAWMWRATFFPNMIATVLSVYYATLPSMADLGLLQLVGTVFQLCWWVCFISMLYCSPSYVLDVGGSNSSKNPFSSYDNALNRIVEVLGSENPMAHLTMSMPTVCHTCHVVRPLRSKHCKVMRRCIHKFDHYCPFVHNTVCRDNYKYFIGVIFLFPPCYLLFMFSTWLFWQRGGAMTWYFVLFLIYSSMLCVMVGALIHYHFGLITRNLTTNEEINVQRYVYLHNEFSRFSNPFDKGSRWNNFVDGLFPSSKAYFTRDAVIEDRRAEMVGPNGRMTLSSGEAEEEESFLNSDAKTKLLSQ